MSIINVCCAVLAAITLTSVSRASAEDVQVTLKSDKSAYSVHEDVNLVYEVLWLGQEDGEIYFNDLAFPELEVSYLNMMPVEMTVLGSFDLRSGPSGHERRVWAPTMGGESQSAPMNSLEGTRYLNGKTGYYDLSRAGRYVVRAIFRTSSAWPLYLGQESDITSSALIIEIVE